MPRRKTHTDKWWADHTPDHPNYNPVIRRCTGHNKSTGERCRAEAAPGTTVCERHGALIPAVQAAAAQRIQMSVDEAARHMVQWLSDPSVDMRERVKVAQDLLDRGGLAATSKHLVGVVGSNDPIETLFLDLLSTPGALAEPNPVQEEPDPEVLELNRRADREEAPDWDDIIDADVVEEAPEEPIEDRPLRNPAIPPKHIREALEELL